MYDDMGMDIFLLMALTQPDYVGRYFETLLRRGRVHHQLRLGVPQHPADASRTPCPHASSDRSARVPRLSRAGGRVDLARHQGRQSKHAANVMTTDHDLSIYSWTTTPMLS